jgi:hypothetical protein
LTLGGVPLYSKRTKVESSTMEGGDETMAAKKKGTKKKATKKKKAKKK